MADWQEEEEERPDWEIPPEEETPSGGLLSVLQPIGKFVFLILLLLLLAGILRLF